MERVNRFELARECAQCGTSFSTHTAGAKYCTNTCRNKAQRLRTRARPDHWLSRVLQCKMCGDDFKLSERSGPNQKYCSDPCRQRGYKRSQTEFHARNPTAGQDYGKTRSGRHGSDTILNRVLRKYPELSRTCEVPGCGEDRVTQLAHRPEFARKGAWNCVRLCAPHMIWILCPTHHTLIDRGFETGESLGLTR